MKTELTATFEMNGKGYRCTERILEVLRSVMPGAKASGDYEAVTWVMVGGEILGELAPL
jgi:hypothetical protein